MAYMASQVVFAAMQEPLRLRVRCTEGQKVNGSQTRLLSRRNEDNDWKLWGVLADGVVDRFHHGDQAGGGVGDRESLDVEL